MFLRSPTWNDNRTLDLGVPNIDLSILSDHNLWVTLTIVSLLFLFFLGDLIHDSEYIGNILPKKMVQITLTAQSLLLMMVNCKYELFFFSTFWLFSFLLKIPIQSVHKDLREDCTPDHLIVQKNWTLPGEKRNRKTIPATAVVNSTAKCTRMHSEQPMNWLPSLTDASQFLTAKGLHKTILQFAKQISQKVGLTDHSSTIYLHNPLPIFHCLLWKVQKTLCSYLKRLNFFTEGGEAEWWNMVVMGINKELALYIYIHEANMRKPHLPHGRPSVPDRPHGSCQF